MLRYCRLLRSFGGSRLRQIRHQDALASWRNLFGVHQTLKVLAMAAGIKDDIWEIEDLLAV